MQLNQYIIELLHKHDCVIVPGFGAFIANLSPASIDKASYIIYPPTKKIAFNRNLTTNDALLAHHITIAENLSFLEALNKINEEVFKWQQAIREKGYLEIMGIGSFKKNFEDKLIFQASGAYNFDFKYFGLESEKLNPIKDKIEIHKKLKKRKNKFWNRSMIISLSSLIPLILILLALVVLSNIHTGKKNQDAGFASTSFWFEERQPPEDAIKPTPKTFEPKKVVHKNHIAKNNVIYHIIGASFVDESNALDFTKKMDMKGYSSEMWLSEHTYWRVSIYQTTSYNQALERLKVIRQKENPNVWLLKK